MCFDQGNPLFPPPISPYALHHYLSQIHVLFCLYAHSQLVCMGTRQSSGAYLAPCGPIPKEN